MNMLEKIVSYSLYPFLISMSILLTLYGFQLLPVEGYFIIPLGISIITVIFVLIGERIVPYRADWAVSSGDELTDALQTFLTLPVFSKLGEVFIISAFGYLIYDYWNLKIAFDLTPFGGHALHLVAVIIVSEFFFYGCHRLFHQFAVLWKIHTIHHGAKRVYWLNSGRFHFVEAFVTSVFYFTPFLFFKPYPETVVLLISISAVSGFLEHVNINLKTRVLNYVFNTPDLHRWHHSNVVGESHKNFGKILIIWDHVFGTYYNPKGKDVRRVGVENVEVADNFWEQTVFPWK